MLKELKETDYKSLIKFRIRKILMICSNYDAFILEEDGQIETQIYKEYIDLNLSTPPTFVWVQTSAQAREVLQTTVGIDMVILPLFINYFYRCRGKKEECKEQKKCDQFF